LSNVLLLDSFLGEIPATAQDGSVTVAGITVPEPATLFLMGIGMAVYGIVRKKGAR